MSYCETCGEEVERLYLVTRIGAGAIAGVVIIDTKPIQVFVRLPGDGALTEVDGHLPHECPEASPIGEEGNDSPSSQQQGVSFSSPIRNQDRRLQALCVDGMRYGDND